jgi:SWI/SNF-related matrix-associated actin-dependent regulator of chromatin subfamily A3
MSNEAEWASVSIQYEHNPNKPGGSETIAPRSRAPIGELIGRLGDGIGVVEQKSAERDAQLERKDFITKYG